MNKMNMNVLVLSGSYEALHVCDVKRAIILCVSGKAHPIENSNEYIHSPSTKMNIPAIIRLCGNKRIPYKPVVFTKTNIFLRDGCICQYCGKKFPSHELTVDHVLPRSRGGKNIWTNVVTSCFSCNNKKGDRTPKESNMDVLNKPRKVTSMSFLHILRKMADKYDAWKKYLFFE